MTVVSTAAAATFVSMPAASRFLEPLLGRELSTAELARRVGVTINSAAYRIRQLLRLGLILRTRSQARAGRAIVFYTAISDRIYAPLTLTSIDSVRDLFRLGLADLSDDLEVALEQAWLRVGQSSDWGTLLYRPHPDAGVNRDFLPRPLAETGTLWDTALADDAPAVWTQHATLDLPHPLAKQLQRELSRLVARYSELAASQPATEPHHLQLTLAPTARLNEAHR